MCMSQSHIAVVVMVVCVGCHVIGVYIGVGFVVRVSLVALSSMHALPACIRHLDRSSHLQVAVNRRPCCADLDARDPSQPGVQSGALEASAELQSASWWWWCWSTCRAVLLQS